MNQISQHNKAIQLTILCIAVWLHAANSMLAATTLPSAIREIGGGELIGWAFALYLLGSILAGSTTAFLIRRLSLNSSMVAAACIYFFGCLVSALAADMIILLIGRLLQGIGGGFLIALVFVALSRWFDKEALPRLMAGISAVWSTSAFAGPLVGGTFSTYGDWRWAFWVFAIKALLFIFACRFLMPMDKPAHAADKTRPPLLRLLVLCSSILSIALAAAVAEPVGSSAWCLLGTLLLWLVFKLDAKSPENRMFSSKPLNPKFTVGAGLLFVIAASFSTMSFLVYGPILLETLHKVTPLSAGYIVAFESIAWGMGAILVSRLTVPPESLLIRTGALLIVSGILGFALFMGSGPIWLLLIFAGCQGLGFGISWAFIVKRITAAALSSEQDVTSTSIPTFQQIGFAFGSAAAGIVANLAGFGESVTVAIAESAAVWIFAAFLPFATLAVIAAWRLTSSHESR